MFGLDLKLNKWLFINLLLILGCVSLACIYIAYPEGDVFEHMVDSLNVYKGKLPYKHFFEHHNPLLWYISGWFINLLDRNIEVIAIMNYITYLFFLVGVFYVYKIIVRFLGNETMGLLASIMILLPDIFLYYIYFKSDNYMFTCISIGIYYFFCYIEKKERMSLILSYLGLWIGFLFIQKALFFYPVLGLMTLYMLYKKDMCVKDFLCAISLPVIGSIAILSYFYCNDMLALYWKSCFVFNSVLREFMKGYSVGGSWFLANVVYVIAILGYILMFKKENIYFRLWGGIFIINLLFKYICFSPHLYYFYEAYYLGVPVAVVVLFKLLDKSKLIKILFMIELQIFVGYNLFNIIHDIKFSINRNIEEFAYQDFIIKRTNKCDKVMGPLPAIFLDNLGYYWFLRGRIDVVGEIAEIHKKDDLNEIVANEKPRIVYVRDIIVQFSKEHEIVYKFDMDMIKKYYYKYIDYSSRDNIYFDNIKKQWVDYTLIDEGCYILKPEYQKLKGQCIYDKENKKWKYENANKTIVSKD